MTNMDNANNEQNAAADHAASIDSQIFTRLVEGTTPRVSPNTTPLGRPETISETGARLKAEDAAKRLHGNTPSADVSAQKMDQQNNENPQPQTTGHQLDVPQRDDSVKGGWA